MASNLSKVLDVKTPYDLEVMKIKGELKAPGSAYCSVCKEMKCDYKQRVKQLCWNCGRACCLDHISYDGTCYMCRFMKSQIKKLHEKLTNSQQQLGNKSKEEKKPKKETSTRKKRTLKTELIKYMKAYRKDKRNKEITFIHSNEPKKEVISIKKWKKERRIRILLSLNILNHQNQRKKQEKHQRIK